VTGRKTSNHSREIPAKSGFLQKKNTHKKNNKLKKINNKTKLLNVCSIKPLIYMLINSSKDGSLLDSLSLYDWAKLSFCQLHLHL